MPLLTETPQTSLGRPVPRGMRSLFPGSPDHQTPKSRNDIEAMYDGPIPPEQRWGGPHAFAIRETLSQFWALTDQARRQIHAIRRTRKITAGHALAHLDPGVRQRLLDGLRADLNFYRSERHRCLRRLSRMLGRDQIRLNQSDS